MALENKTDNAGAGSRQLVTISGYYGFNNLGDDAILETLVDELKLKVGPENIVVLSNSPEETKRRFKVSAINRWQAGPLIKTLLHTRLFISGGGGLFQDTVSIRSPIFYGTQIAMAKTFGSRVMVFAQGLGPLNTKLGKALTRGALGMCDEITLRDDRSWKEAIQWGLNAELTADPVWALEQKPLPEEILSQLQPRDSQSIRVGLSLRVINHFSEDKIPNLVKAMAEALPDNAVIVPLVLQPDQDSRILKSFTEEWNKLGRKTETIETSKIELPSQWITLLAQLDMTIAMRLHCVIMSIRAGTPTVAIAYDPKVSHVSHKFELPTLNLTKEGEPEGGIGSWISTLETAMRNKDHIAAVATEKAETTRKLACQNFAVVDRILSK